MTLQNMILEAAPDATKDMYFKMPSYHIGEQWVAIVSQKFYISLYTCNPNNLQKFRDAFPHIRTGQGCINFKDKDELSESAIKEVILASLYTKEQEYG